MAMSSSHITHRECLYVRLAIIRAKVNEPRITADMLRSAIYDANDVSYMEISVNKTSAAVGVKKRCMQFDSNQYNFIPRRFGTCHIQGVVYGRLPHELIAHLHHVGANVQAKNSNTTVSASDSKMWYLSYDTGVVQEVWMQIAAKISEILREDTKHPRVAERFARLTESTRLSPN